MMENSFQNAHLASISLTSKVFLVKIKLSLLNIDISLLVPLLLEGSWFAKNYTINSKAEEATEQFLMPDSTLPIYYDSCEAIIASRQD